MKSFKNEGKMWDALCKELEEIENKFNFSQSKECRSRCQAVFDRYRENYPEYAWILADNVDGFFCDDDGNITRVIYVR